MSDTKHSTDFLLERCGFIRCQIDVTDMILIKQKTVLDKLKVIRERMEKEIPFLERQELKNEAFRLTGESDALRLLWTYISQLRFEPSAAILQDDEIDD